MEAVSTVSAPVPDCEHQDWTVELDSLGILIVILNYFKGTEGVVDLIHGYWLGANRRYRDTQKWNPEIVLLNCKNTIETKFQTGLDWFSSIALRITEASRAIKYLEKRIEQFNRVLRFSSSIELRQETRYKLHSAQLQWNTWGRRKRRFVSYLESDSATLVHRDIARCYLWKHPITDQRRNTFCDEKNPDKPVLGPEESGLRESSKWLTRIGEEPLPWAEEIDGGQFGIPWIDEEYDPLHLSL